MKAECHDDNGFRILYVDDEPGLLELGKIFLEMNQGIIVDTASGPHEALTRMESHRYGVVVSDYQMPEMDGIEFLKKLRGDGNDVPFIIFTGKGREEVVIEALNNGADFYLQKGGDARSQFAELWNMVRHVLDRRASEKELNASRCLMDATIDSIPDIIGVMNTDCEVLCYNQAGYEYLGRNPEEVLGKKCHIAENKDAHCSECEFEQAKKNGHLVEFERYDPVNDVYLDCRVNPVFDQESELRYLVEIIRDVTQRKKSEERLRQSEEMYRSLVSHYGQGIAILNQGNLLYVNPQAVDVMGYSEDEMMRMSYTDLIHPDDLEAVTYRMRMRENGEPHEGCHLLRLLPKDGSTIWAESRAKSVEWNGFDASLLLFTDVTDRMRMSKLWDGVIGLIEDLLRGCDLNKMLESIAMISQRNDPDIRSTVLLYDPLHHLLRLGAAPHMPTAYHRHMMQGMQVSDSTGSCGVAAHRKRMVVVRDILEDPRCANMGAFLDIAREHGIRSCYSYPILAADGSLLGTITNYGSRSGIPDAEAIHLLEQTAKVAALVISQRREA
ncbi:MAG: PAS domain S-box protein [Candidatus Methanomethylophilaceae archaeon]|nr:PAS domain S-box protein [Candidatus Methanomethylophilaceae archaeon]